VNRKHVRRFGCDLCQSAFNLNNDLERHKRTVHHKHSYKLAGHMCTNAHCITPGKVFVRKDNFDRHVKRCAKRQQLDLSLQIATGSKTESTAEI
jgi:uncharacterized Zn-finger protein